MTRQLVKNLERDGQSQPQGRLIMTAAREISRLMDENYKIRCELQIALGKSVEDIDLDKGILVDE
jgi:hypothetical protein